MQGAGKGTSLQTLPPASCILSLFHVKRLRGLRRITLARVLRVPRETHKVRSL